MVSAAQDAEPSELFAVEAHPHAVGAYPEVLLLVDKKRVDRISRDVAVVGIEDDA